MGSEYKIAFQIGDPAAIEQFLARLRSQQSIDERDLHFTVALEPDGFYFCGYTKSQQSTSAFRRLIDEALKHSKAVVYEL